MKPPIVGIIGGIGSGKSLVADELVRHGGWLITGDALGHEALRQSAIKEQVVKRWGRELLDEQGEIQRRLLGHKVFPDAKELRTLEVLVFPWIGRRMTEEIAKAREQAAPLIVVDAAVMMEAGWDKNCDRLIFVEAPRAARLARLKDKRGWSERDLTERENSQLPLGDKRRRADEVIDNSGTPDQLARRVDALLREWKIIQ
jgi:dephospho-CoA kinase